MVASSNSTRWRNAFISSGAAVIRFHAGHFPSNPKTASSVLMSVKPLPEIGKPYSTPQGFTMWRPQFTALTVIPCAQGGCEIIVTQPGAPEVCFALDDAQRLEFVGHLLAKATTSIAQPAAAAGALAQGA